jgi:hypothetical protein
MTNTTSGISAVAAQAAIYGDQNDTAGQRTSPKVVLPAQTSPVADQSPDKSPGPVGDSGLPEPALTALPETDSHWVRQEIAQFHFNIVQLAHTIASYGSTTAGSIEEVLSNAEKIAAHIEQKVEQKISKARKVVHVEVDAKLEEVEGRLKELMAAFKK